MSKDRLYVVIRVPKTGSRTLKQVMRSALPDARFHLLPNPSKPDAGVSLIERVRVSRGKFRRRWRNQGGLSNDHVMRDIAETARDGDIVIGHFGIRDFEMPGFELDRITMIRNPVDRLTSEYFYSRRGYEKRNPLRRFYNRGRLRAAATLGFSDYLAFLHDHLDLYANRATRFVTGENSCSDPEKFLLENYFHFGTLEQIDKFSEALFSKLGNTVELPHHNLSNNRSEIVLTTRDKNRLDDLCGEDFKLHKAMTDLVNSGQTGGR